jgi:hypothetical protein
MIVVDALSATPPLPGVHSYGIEATHTGMCRYENENAPGYQMVTGAVRQWVAESPFIIDIRWRKEDTYLKLRANLNDAERLQQSVSTPP